MEKEEEMWRYRIRWRSLIDPGLTREEDHMYEARRLLIFMNELKDIYNF